MKANLLGNDEHMLDGVVEIAQLSRKWVVVRLFRVSQLQHGYPIQEKPLDVQDFVSNGTVEEVPTILWNSQLACWRSNDDPEGVVRFVNTDHLDVNRGGLLNLTDEALQ